MTELERLQVRQETLVEVHEFAQNACSVADILGMLTARKRTTRNKIRSMRKALSR